ncbi:DUF6600 domain-containing protein [Flavobacterium aestivum]|uniref:DUF6600 domain-containing protein n=1 Tax=Flavobacterium aestivum TaxID=3003257 RepID=UPI0024830960|nr:DUF6600 domain-containing protein [Flavobacterium aestivum]
MKFISKIAVLLIAFNSWTMIVPQQATAQVSISFQVFYDDLSPYGSWVLNTHYGYVWLPDVSPGFIPYGTNGHWVYSNVGWTWVSNYSWGWAPFHYGRWYYDYIYGWIWVPDYEWGPAWVVWRRSEGYYGWAPIGPGISINIAYGGNYILPYNQWIVVRDRDLGRTNINNYYVRTPDNSRILKNSTVINNIRTDNTSHARYGIGPNRNEVQRSSGNAITTYTVRDRNKPGHNLSNRELNIYKPRVEKHNASGQKPIPYKVISMKDAKSTKQSNTRTNPSQQKRYDQPTQQPQQKHQEQPKQQQRYDQPAQQPQQKRHEQPKQQQRYDQPAQQSQQDRGQHMKQPRYEQPAQQPQQKHHEQPKQQQRYDQPAQQPQQDHGQPMRQPRYEQPAQQPQQDRGQHMQQPHYEQPAQQPQQDRGQHMQQQHSQKHN